MPEIPLTPPRTTIIIIRPCRQISRFETFGDVPRPVYDSSSSVTYSSPKLSS